MRGVDTNAIVRGLTGDDPHQAAKAHADTRISFTLHVLTRQRRFGEEIALDAFRLSSWLGFICTFTGL